MSSFQAGPGKFYTNQNNTPSITIQGLSSDTKPSATTFSGFYFYETDTGNTYLAYNGIWNKVLKASSSSSSGTGSGIGSKFTANGGGTSFTIAHGLGVIPTFVEVGAGSADARGNFSWTADANNITVTYPVATPSGTNNVVLWWTAGTLSSPISVTGGINTSSGSATQSGNASTTVFNIPHGLTTTPSNVVIEPNSVDALGDFTWTVNATNIVLTYQVAPPSGTNNLTWNWIAATSTASTLQNMTIDADLNTIVHRDMTTDYVIYVEGNTVKAMNMKTGVIDSSGTAADVVVNQCITNLTGNGGKMVFSANTFVFNNPLVFPAGTINTPFNRFILQGSMWGGNVANNNTTFIPANNATNLGNRSLIECLPALGSGLKSCVSVKDIMFYHPYGVSGFDLGAINLAADVNTIMGDNVIQRCSFNGFNRGIRIQGYMYHQWMKDLYFTGLAGSGKYHIRVDNDVGYADKADFLVFDNIHTSNGPSTVLDNQFYIHSNYSTFSNIQTDGWTYNVAPLELADCTACTIHDYGGTDLNGNSATAVGAIYLHQTVTDGCYGNRILNTKATSYPPGGGGVNATVYVDGGAHHNYVQLAQFGGNQIVVNEASGSNNTFEVINDVSTAAVTSQPVKRIALDPTSRVIDKRKSLTWGPSTNRLYGMRQGFVSGQITTTCGQGLLGAVTAATNGTASSGVATTQGPRISYITNAVANNRAGWLGVSIGWRALYPRIRFRFALQQTNSANNRLYIGLVDTTTQPVSGTAIGDTWMDTRNGVALGYRTTDAGWMIISNNGSATATYTSAGLPAIDTNIHTFELWADDANARFLWTFDNGSVNILSTTVPGSTTLLVPQFLLETAVATSYGMYELSTEVEQNAV